jgi:hypothetical protein
MISWSKMVTLKSCGISFSPRSYSIVIYVFGVMAKDLDVKASSR